MNREGSIIGGIAVLAILTIGGFMLLSGDASPTSVTSEATVDANRLTRGDSYTLGSGAVTLTEFGDFQCPACGQAHPIVKQVMGEYQGKVRFVFRNFPLPGHKNAGAAANAAEAAGAQGKFWEMHDIIYTKQREWSESNKVADIFANYAQGLGLDSEKIKTAAEKNEFGAKITRDVSDGESVGVNATPTFFVNDKKVTGGYSYPSLKAAIDQAMK